MHKIVASFFLAVLMLSTVQAQTMFGDLKIENLGKDTLYRPFDSNNPKSILRIVNTGSKTSPKDIQINVKAVDLPGAENGMAMFPNGGMLVELAPGESTFVSCWLRGLWDAKSGPAVDSNFTERTVEFSFSRGPSFPGISVHTRKYFISLYTKTSLPEGGFPIKGVVQLPPGVTSAPKISIGTAYWNSQNISTTLENGKYSFTTSLKAPLLHNRIWYVKITADQCNDTIVKVPLDQSVLNIVLSKRPDITIPNFKLIGSPVNTNNGFWRGAVSESEGTVTLFPGQENWKTINGCKDSALVTNAKLYKYNYKTGAKLWEHTPGWETWGGDMSRDGKFVTYAFETGIQGNCYTPGYVVRTLNGNTGEVIWERTTDKILESKEVAISPNSKFVAVGSISRVALLDVTNGKTLWATPETLMLGQVRKLAFDKTSEFLYAGSGDNFLRKIRVSDGKIIWKTFIWGWPFVNGFSMNAEGTKIVVGTKSCDITQINDADGSIDWHFDTGNFDDATFSPDGKYVVTYSGYILNSANGALIGRTSIAPTFFSANSKMILKMPNQIEFYSNAATFLGKTNITGITLGQLGGSQSQWSYLTGNDKYAIISGRDMGYAGGPSLPAQGILFYENQNVASAHTEGNFLPGEFSLEQNYPNPFNPSTTIEYRVPVRSTVSLKIYDLLGRELATLVDGIKDAGTHQYRFSAEQYSGGVYFYSLQSGNYRETKKLLLLK